MSNDWLNRHARAGARRRAWRQRWSEWRSRPKHPAPTAAAPARPATAEEQRIELALRERVSTNAAFGLLVGLPTLGYLVPVGVSLWLGIELSAWVITVAVVALAAAGLYLFTRLASSDAHAQDQRVWLASLPFALDGYPEVLGSDRNRPRLVLSVAFASPVPPERQQALMDACQSALGSKVERVRFDQEALVLSSTDLDCLVMPDEGDSFISNGPMHLWTKHALRRFLLPLHQNVALQRVSFKAVGS